MANYRATIKKMDPQQKKELEKVCQKLGVKVEISRIKPVGQPSKINEIAFAIRYQDYLAGSISAPKLGAEFGLSKSGIFKKFEKSKGVYKTRTQYWAEQSVNVYQEPVASKSNEESMSSDSEYSSFDEFEGFPEELAVTQEEQTEESGADIFGDIDEWEDIDEIVEQIEKGV